MRSKLEVCGSCSGFLPPRVKACPHCHASRRETKSSFDPLRLGALGTLLTGGTMAITLMACYGAPCTDSTCGGPYYREDGGQEEDDAGSNTPDVKVTPKDAGTDSSDAAADADDASIADAADGG